VLGPYSKYQLVERLLGSTVQLSVAVLEVTLEALPVATWGAEDVVSSPSAP
jgi:hypothetical protein